MSNRLAFVWAMILSLTAYGQSAQPAAVWFQPVRNVPGLTGMGINTFVGPEVENGHALPPDQLAAQQVAWIKAIADAGGKVVLKTPPANLPANCVGVLLTVDEPNGKGIIPATIKPESDRYRGLYPGKDIWLSLAGDKILSANLAKPAEAQLLKDYCALADVITIDFYEKNRNADRYPDTNTGDIVAKVLSVAPGKRVLPWYEANDQQLTPPPPGQGTNRAPTPTEMRAKVDYADGKGAWGRGFFLTCDSGKYGWPGSYLPQIDRNGQTMAPQYQTMQMLSRQINPIPPPTTPTLEQRVAELERKMNGISASTK